LKNRGIRASFLACPFVFVNKDIFIVDIIIECDIMGKDCNNLHNARQRKEVKNEFSLECGKRYTSAFAEVPRR